MPDTELFQLDQDVLCKILENAPLTDAYNGKRTFSRHVFPMRMDLFQEHVDGEHRKIYVSGKDISLVGIGLTCRVELQANDLVVVVLEHEGVSLACHARVAHCTPMISGYQVGLKWEFD